MSRRRKPVVRVHRRDADWVLPDFTDLADCTTNHIPDNEGQPPCTGTAVWKVVELYDMHATAGFWCDNHLPDEHRPAIPACPPVPGTTPPHPNRTPDHHRVKEQQPMSSRRTAAITAYILAIAAANWLTTRYGIIPMGFGLTATAGTYCAGAALLLRDVAQDACGWRWVLAGIGAGAALTALTSPALAVASAVAFLLAELLDMAVDHAQIVAPQMIH